jgi:hypothetical protein
MRVGIDDANRGLSADLPQSPDRPQRQCSTEKIHLTRPGQKIRLWKLQSCRRRYDVPKKLRTICETQQWATDVRFLGKADIAHY